MKKMNTAFTPFGIAGTLAAVAALTALVWGVLRYQKEQKVKQRSKDAMHLLGNVLLAASGEDKQ